MSSSESSTDVFRSSSDQGRDAFQIWIAITLMINQSDSHYCLHGCKGRLKACPPSIVTTGEMAKDGRDPADYVNHTKLKTRHHVITRMIVIKSICSRFVQREKCGRKWNKGKSRANETLWKLDSWQHRIVEKCGQISFFVIRACSVRRIFVAGVSLVIGARASDEWSLWYIEAYSPSWYANVERRKVVRCSYHIYVSPLMVRACIWNVASITYRYGYVSIGGAAIDCKNNDDFI